MTSSNYKDCEMGSNGGLEHTFKVVVYFAMQEHPELESSNVNLNGFLAKQSSSSSSSPFLDLKLNLPQF